MSRSDLQLRFRRLNPGDPLLRKLGILSPKEIASLPLTEPLLSTLKSGEEAVISYESGNCFATVRYEFMCKGPMPLAVSARPTPTRLGALRLTKRDVVRLDRAIAFYRAQVPGFSTGVDKVKIRWTRCSGNRTETYRDATGGLKTSQQVLRFGDLIPMRSPTVIKR